MAHGDLHQGGRLGPARGGRAVLPQDRPGGLHGELGPGDDRPPSRQRVVPGSPGRGVHLLRLRTSMRRGYIDQTAEHRSQRYSPTAPYREGAVLTGRHAWSWSGSAPTCWGTLASAEIVSLT